MNYAIVQDGTNLVLNIVVWDGNVDTWQPPVGTTAVQLQPGEFCEIGGTFTP